MTTKIKNQNKTMTLINEGEVNIVKPAGLTELNFDILIPCMQYPFAVYPDGFQNGEYYILLLKKLKEEEKPFRFILARNNLVSDLNMNVILEDYSINEDAKEGKDIVVSINLKQYKEVKTKTVSIQNTVSETGEVITEAVIEEQRPSDKTPAKSCIVKQGDSLWEICQREMGDGSKCWEIAKKNKIPNPNKIRPGQVILFD